MSPALLLACNAPSLIITALDAWQAWCSSKAIAQVLAQLVPMSVTVLASLVLFHASIAPQPVLAVNA